MGKITRPPQEGKFDWDTEDIAVDERLVFSMGESIRLMIADTKVFMSSTHRIELGKDRVEFRRCKELDGKVCPDCRQGSVVSKKFGCNVIVYRDDGEEGGELTWELLPWLFGKKTYRILKGVFAQLKAAGEEKHPFLAHDLYVECYNATFQNVKIEPYDDALWTRVPGLKEEIITEYKAHASPVLEILQHSAGKVGGSQVVRIKKKDAEKVSKKGEGQPKVEEPEVATEPEEVLEPVPVPEVKSEEFEPEPVEEELVPEKAKAKKDDDELSALLDGLE